VIGLMGLAGCVGEAGIIYALVILLRLSQKLGDVTKAKPYYRGYYVAMGVLVLALVMRLLAAIHATPPVPSGPSTLCGSGPYTLVHDVLFAVGLTIALPITFKYWGWLLRELDR